MSRKLFKPALMTSVVMLTIGMTGISTAGASTANKVTICYNRTNGVVHFAPSGRCASSQTAVVVGRGIIGERGAVGLVGPTGPAGGPQGVQGLQGIQGVVGPIGGTGVAGPPGVNAVHIVTITSTGTVAATVSAVCATGQVVTGGGFINSATATITSSVAHAGGVSWDVSFTGNTVGTVTVQAICAVGTESP
jgi:hypothetical protein